MFLEKAEIFQFRNYDKVSLDFHSFINIFVGENGQGKSSFLEALYCALRGKSFHPFVRSQFIQKDKEFSKIRLSFKEKEGRSQIETAFFLSQNYLKKELFYCGKKVKADFFLEKFPCFVFTESSLKCIRQSSSERRNFIEELFHSPSHIQARSSFERVLRQKKELLKSYKKALIEEMDFLKLLKPLNEKFLSASCSLVQARLEVLDQIYSLAPQIALHFFKEPIPSLDFQYLIDDGESLKKESDIFSVLKEDLNQKTRQELLAGIPLSGPHRHEIKFLFNGEDSRTFCSKGQQRSYVLSLLLCHIQNFTHALLFLDDVLLELDDNIQKKFLSFLEKKNCQIFLTSCKITSFKTEKMSFFYVKEGRVTKCDNGYRNQ